MSAVPAGRDSLIVGMLELFMWFMGGFFGHIFGKVKGRCVHTR